MHILRGKVLEDSNLLIIPPKKKSELSTITLMNLKNKQSMLSTTSLNTLFPESIYLQVKYIWVFYIYSTTNEEPIFSIFFKIQRETR